MGSKWGDSGFFRIKNGRVLNMKFYDIYWFETDLTEKEKNAYKEFEKEQNQMVTGEFRKIFPAVDQTNGKP